MSEKRTVGDLIELLRALLPDEGEPEEDLPRFGRPLILWIIRELERVPKPRGNLSRKIRGRARIRQDLVLQRLRARRQRLRENGMTATDAEWQAAEEGVALFRKFTGRRLSSDTVRRLMQRLVRRPRTEE